MVFNKKTNKTINEVWDGFVNNHSSEENPSPTSTLINQSLEQTPNLEDFLSGPFGRENSQPTNLSPHFTVPATPPVLIFNTMAGDGSHSQLQNVHCSTAGNGPCIIMHGSAGGGATTSHGRRNMVQPNATVNYRELKRLIKNRESAARSRAKQQAYHAELEAGVSCLRQENKRLRMIHEELAKAVAVGPESAKKQQLTRAYTV